jgi:hypothetical protein
MKSKAKIIVMPFLMLAAAFVFRFAEMDKIAAVPVYAASPDIPMRSFAVYDMKIPAPEKIVIPKKLDLKSAPTVTKTLLVPDIDTGFKAYMDYRTITDTKAPQWKLRERAYTDDYGFRRIADDYVVALGTYYSEKVGERFRITLDTGVSFTVITGDIKDPAHTDAENMYTPLGNKNSGGCVVEFLVDTDILDKSAAKLGTISYFSFFEGNIENIEKLS